MAGYILKEKIRETKHSSLFRAVKPSADDKKDSLTFLIKQYHTGLTEDIVENERRISQTIEETCPFSVIIPILETFEEEGKTCVVMQFRKNGLFLNEVVERLEDKYGSGNIPLNIVSEITGKILESLVHFHEYIHEGKKKGYLHLDLNPGNIFLESADVQKESWGTVKFIDFGSSVEVEQKDNILRERNWIACTPYYAAPEVEQNIVSHMIPATDLYSVCKCMIHMLAGKSCYRLEKEGLGSILDRKNPIVGAFLQDIIENATCVPSYYRYENAAQMKKEIDFVSDFQFYMEEGRYYELLSVCYERSLPVELFSDSHLPMVQKGFSEAVRKLEKELRGDNVQYRRCLYIFEALYFMSEKQAVGNGAVLKSLWLSGTTCYNYLGQQKKALELYDKMWGIVTSVSVESYITLRLRYAVTMADCCRYEKAWETVSEIIRALEAFKINASKKIDIKLAELGRAYSAAGTYLAFQNKENPLVLYEKALQEFEGDRGNSAITYTKILHYAIEIGNQDLFEKYVPYYFGRNIEDCSALLQRIWDNAKQPGYPFGYSMFLFLKAVHAFYLDRADDGFYKILEQCLETKSLFKKEHPEQLIFKYAALLFHQHGDEQKARSYQMRALRWIREGTITKEKELNIFMLMNYQTAWLFHELDNKEKENQKLLQDFLAKTESSFWQELHHRIEQEKSLGRLLNHEYC